MQEWGGAGGSVLGGEDSKLRGDEVKGILASSRKGKTGEGLEGKAGWNYQRLHRTWWRDWILMCRAAGKSWKVTLRGET